jgi:hypothetical protein
MNIGFAAFAGFADRCQSKSGFADMLITPFWLLLLTIRNNIHSLWTLVSQISQMLFLAENYTGRFTSVFVFRLTLICEICE